MSLRFFADHCVPTSIVRLLKDAGNQVLRVSEYIPADSSDTLVISTAQRLDAILLTLNGDFVDIVSYPPARFKGIVALQIRNHPETIPQLMSRLIVYLSAHSTLEEYAGKLLLVQPHRIRIRG